MCVLGFIGAQRWGPPLDNQQGLTWLELLSIFTLHGGSPDDIGLEPDYLAQPRASLRKLVSAFKARVLSLVGLYLVPQDRLFFRPTKVARHRLSSIGFLNHVPAITGLIALSNDRAAIVAKSLVKLRHTFSRNSNIAWNREELALKPTRLSYRGSPDWAALPDVFEDLDPDSIRNWMNELSFQTPEIPPKVWLSCPHCGFLKDVKQTTLFGNGKWTATSCLRPTCRKTATSRKWFCP